LSQYQSVNSQAESTASTPFQTYSGQFVAPTTQTQNAGIAATNADANEAAPYYGAATSTLGSTQAGVNPVNEAAAGLAGASAEQVNAAPLTGADVNQYLSPYLGDVLGTTNALANQNNNIAQAGQLGTAISSGAFGGDRTGLAAANLQQQNALAEQSTDANILNTGYNTALSTAQQQQGVNLAAGQANRTALGAAGSELAGIGSTAYGEGANTASELGSLGTGAQAAGLSGAQAQIAAGTVQQQTAQAQDTAEYNQFLQQQSYPFQVDQFLASIAEGTGALSGSTTTTTQPGGFFSDRRLKHDIKKIGKTYDGQTIYSYKMHGDKRTHIGLIAQDVQKKHPEAVGLAAGFKTVDYGKATDSAANRGHFAGGGIAGRGHYDGGGYAGPYGDMSSILATQENMYQPNQTRNRNIPNQTQNHQLAVASGSPQPQPTGASKVQQSIGLGKDAYSAYNHFNAPSSPNMAPTNAQIATDPDMQALQQSPSLAAAPESPAAAPGLGGAAATDAGATAAPTAGLAGGDAAAAAAPAAASVAAPAAADAAAGAVGGAAVDAGATEAAALAAEYAAADVGVAALAAKRGGRIQRRGYDAGGMPYEGGVAGAPYSDPSGQMDIPDDPNTAKLQTAGPLVKRPTGLQTAMTLGSEQGASSALGSMFSNQGLGSARGGRIGYDDGGTVDPSADPDLSPVVIDPSDVKLPEPGLGAASMRAANDDSAPAPVPQKKSALAGIGDWWDRNKTDVIPALQGLAAMGTAPTRHLGVALAAGLGAGAQSYMPTQQQAADVQQRQLQNQMAQTQLGMLRGAMQQPQQGASGPSAPAAAPPSNQNDLQSYYANKYNPNMTPQELSRYNQAQIVSGATKNPGYQQAAMTDYEQRVKNQQIAARLEHDQANTIATADGGNYQILKQVNPLQAQAIAKTLGFDPSSGSAPPAADAAAVKYATDVVDFTHPWTGDTYTDQEGQRANSRTGAPPPPQSRAAQQLSPQQKQEAYEKFLTLGQTPNTVGAGLPQMPWQRANAASPETYAAAHVPGGYTPPQPAAAGAPSQGTPPRPPVRPQPTSAPNTQPARSQTQLLPGVDIGQTPRMPAIPAATDQPSLDAAKKRAASNVELQDSGMVPFKEQATAATRNTAIYSQLDKTLANANPREFGPGSSQYKALMNFKTYLSGLPPDGLVNQAEADKYLAQLGVGGSKQLLGADQQLRQQEMLMLMAHANPNIDQPLQVVKNLSAFGKAGNTYDLLAANTAMAAIRNGADPDQVGSAIENQSHRADYIQQQLGVPIAAPKRPGQAASGPAVIIGKAQYDALPSGAAYVFNGRTGTKP
jgi:hypothetical protein